ncbi:HD domain-containing protein [Ectobacillus panaciterrae]|uniref:HD domain-containing protein n=1 Tax=Ectobacillus panaciterrae TaxID=363872 RepID=UPI00040FFAFA|nr:HD domain-containing protein [Ectobacillus panaciterrae]
MDRNTVDVWSKAVEVATVAHKAQQRKGNGTPYITHPYTVAMLLAKSGCTQDVVVAGLLHDTVEDTSLSYEDVKREFGETVARLVEECSEHDKEKSWEERKQYTIDKLQHISAEGCMITCADKLHNIRSTVKEFEVCGEAVWNRFNRGKDKQKWYYCSLVTELGKRIPGFPLYVLLKQEVEDLFGKGNIKSKC